MDTFRNQTPVKPAVTTVTAKATEHKPKVVLTRKEIDRRTHNYLVRKGRQNYYTLWKPVAEERNIKPEMTVCIAVAESGLGKNMVYENNIGNVGATGYDTITDGIKAIAQRGIGGRTLRNLQTLGQLSCYGREIHGLQKCGKSVRVYSMDRRGNFHRNVSKCLSQIYGEKIDGSFIYKF